MEAFVVAGGVALRGEARVEDVYKRQILKDEKDVEIAGAQDHVRIVGRMAAEAKTQAFLENLPDILDVIGRLSIP